MMNSAIPFEKPTKTELEAANRFLLETSTESKEMTAFERSVVELLEQKHAKELESTERQRPLVIALRVGRYAAVLLIATGMAFATGFAAGKHSNGVLSFQSSIEFAAGMLQTDDADIWVAIDTPGYGGVSHPKSFEALLAAAHKRVRSTSPDRTHICWYGPKDDRHYLEKDAQVDVATAEKSSQRMRETVLDKADVTEVGWPRLNDFNFFVSRQRVANSNSYEYRSLIFFVDQPKVGEKGAIGRGIVSRNSDVGELLIEMHSTLARNSKLNPSTKP